MRTERSTLSEQIAIAAIIGMYCVFAFALDARFRFPLSLNMPFLVLGFLAGLSVHELAHAVVATLLGDPTARQEGRLTLNPLAHLHPLGTLLILLAGFGWARPVGCDPMQLRGGRRGMAIIAAAGPLANLAVSLLAVIAAAFAFDQSWRMLAQAFGGLCAANLLLFVFNLIPIPPLDGGRVLCAMLPERLLERLEPAGLVAAIALLALSILSVIPNMIGLGATFLLMLVAVVGIGLLFAVALVRAIVAGLMVTLRIAGSLGASLLSSFDRGRRTEPRPAAVRAEAGSSSLASRLELRSSGSAIQ